MYLHRRMMVIGSQVLPLLPPMREVRKDKPLPPWACSGELWWEIYVDDWKCWHAALGMGGHGGSCDQDLLRPASSHSMHSNKI